MTDTGHSRAVIVGWTVVGALGLLVCTNGPVLISVRRHIDRTAGLDTPEVRAWFIAVALLGFGLVAHAMVTRRLASWSTSGPGLLAVTAYLATIGVSTLWSVDRSLTLGRALIYVGLAAFAWWLASASVVDARAVVVLMAALGVGISIVTVFGWRHVGLDPTDDSWRGLYTGRNSLAPIAAIGVLGGLNMVLEHRPRARTADIVSAAGLLLTVASAAVLIGTANRTAPVALVIAISVPVGWALVSRVGRDRGRGAARSATAGLAILFGVLMWPTLDAVWSTGTIETRRSIWTLVRSRIEDRPLHGFGFTVVWDVPAYSADLYAEIGTVFGSAHNSWLEVWLGAGLAGLASYTLLVFVALWNATRDFRSLPGAAAGFWLALVIFLVLENVTESFVLWHSYNWVILVVAALRRPLAGRASPASVPAREGGVAAA